MGSFEYEYVPTTEDTCKTKWTFRVKDGVIESVSIEGEKGCLGHPRTIEVLLRMRALDSVDAEALAKAGCTRSFSCGQALAKALGGLRKRMS